jgi:flagellar hook protein FlgE
MLDLYVNVRNSLDGLLSALRIAISNANNFNTPGYKYTYASFTTVYNQVLSAGTESVNPQTIPGSMTIGSMSTDFSQGYVSYGTELDVAVVGDGFFVLSGSAESFDSGGEKILARSGRFQTDYNNDYLTDAFGRKVFGYKVNANGVVEDSSLVPIRTGGFSDVGFIDGGILVSNFKAHKEAVATGDAPPVRTPMYKLALSTVPNKQGLILGDGASYRMTIASGEMLDPATSGEDSYGDVLGEKLESSNINVAKVAMDMNLLNRGFSAIQGVIDDINKVFTQTISKITG